MMHPALQQRLASMMAGAAPKPTMSGPGMAAVQLMAAAQQMGIDTQGKNPQDVAMELWSRAPTPEVGRLIQMAGIQPPQQGPSMAPDSSAGLMPGPHEMMPPMMRPR